ncbi:MAG: hypothetical protein PVH91_12175 [Pseudomonadales bacterium]|jgi:hypothetical protein
MRRLLSVWLAVLAPAAAVAAPVTCEYGELTRKVEVVYVNPGQAVPCEVIYDKSGEGSIETLWRASNEAGYCEAQAATLVDKLTGMGWRCGKDPEPGDIP